MNANGTHLAIFATLSLGGALLCGAHTAAIVNISGGYVGVPGVTLGYVVLSVGTACNIYGKAAYQIYLGMQHGQPVYENVPAISATVVSTNALPASGSAMPGSKYTEYTLSGQLDDGTDVTGVQVYVDQYSTINVIVQ